MTVIPGIPETPGIPGTPGVRDIPGVPGGPVDGEPVPGAQVYEKALTGEPVAEALLAAVPARPAAAQPAAAPSAALPAAARPTAAQPDGSSTVGHRLAADALLPAWMRPVVRRVDGSPLPDWVLHATEPVPADARRSAVLMLLADGRTGPDLLLVGRAAGLRAHGGQPAFPGGALEPGEGAVAAALREGNEETGLDPASVIPAAALPQLYLRPSGYLVQPVLSYWRRPGPVRAVDLAETASVARVPIADLAEPANRGSVVLPVGSRGSLRTPAFSVAGLVVWGFTAGLVDLLLDWGGWSVPWDRSRELTPTGLPPGGLRP